MKKLKISSILMIIFAIPMAALSMVFLDSASREFTYAGLGCLIMAIIYLFSIITGILGLVFSKKENKKACKIFGWIQLIASVSNIFLLLGYAVFLLPPIAILTILYLTAKV